MICRKTILILSDTNSLLPEHKNGDFVLEKPKIEGSEGLGAHGLCGRVANSTRNGCRLAGSWPRAGRELTGNWPGTGRGQMLRHRTKNRKG